MNEKTKAAMERLEQGIESLLNSEQWQQFLRFQSVFHQYSFANALLIMIQRPNASYVAGFNQWKKLGRSVNKGEHGIEIFAPLFYGGRSTKSTVSENLACDVDEGSSLAPPTRRTLYGYKTVYVFDVSQTSGEPLPKVERPRIVEGESGLFYTLRKACPFPLFEASSLDGANGRFNKLTESIEVLETLPEAHKAKTLIHEWAHGILHSKDAVNLPSKAMREFEAESTAFVVSQAFGLDTSGYSFSYIAGWSGTEGLEALRSGGARIQKAANEILLALANRPLMELAEAM